MLQHTGTARMFVKTGNSLENYGNSLENQRTFCLLGIVASDLVQILLQTTSQRVTGTLSVSLGLCGKVNT